MPTLMPCGWYAFDQGDLSVPREAHQLAELVGAGRCEGCDVTVGDDHQMAVVLRVEVEVT